MSKEDKHKEDKHKEEKTKYEKNKDKELHELNQILALTPSPPPAFSHFASSTRTSHQDSHPAIPDQTFLAQSI